MPERNYYFILSSQGKLFSEKVMFEQRFKEGEGASHEDIGEREF